jgi:hypothetical protein
MKRLASALLLCLALHPLMASADPSASYKLPLDCSHGPVTKSFGNSDWLTYSCSDGKTVVLVSAPGSPASPFVFTIFPLDGVYRVTGQGTGPRLATDPAYAALSKLSTQNFQTIIKDTLSVPPTPMPAESTSPTPSCTESLPVTADKLIGDWASVNDPNRVTLQYSADGSFSGKLKSSGKVMWLFAGTWKLEGKTLSSVYTFSSLDSIPKGTTDSDEILAIGCGVVVTRGKANHIERYQRLQD